LLLNLVAPLSILLPIEKGEQEAQRFRRVSDEVHLHRIAQRQHVRLDVDLNAASLALFGHELGIREP
jgi:hypothetical protein